MINDSFSVSIYTDFQGLAELRAAAGRQTPAALHETARQFEALFVQSMLKAMRAASPGGGLFDSDQSDFYRDMHDQQLALEIVKGRGLGIASMLIQDLGDAQQQAGVPLNNELQRGVTPLNPAPAGVDQPRPLIDVNRPAKVVINLAEQSASTLIKQDAGPPQPPVTVNAVINDWLPEDPAAFIRDLLPVARAGAARLGVSPAVLVAQAALETGWGRRMIRHADGRNSFNLFGIKADSRWQGDRATVTTLEYAGGVAARQQAAFRSYGSLVAAVDNYVEFLQANPRYHQVVENTGDNKKFLRGLKDAGYATDPDYVEKIHSIMNGKFFQDSMEQLALTGREPGEARVSLW